MKPTTPTKPPVKIRYISKDSLFGLCVLLAAIIGSLIILYLAS